MGGPITIRRSCRCAALQRHVHGHPLSGRAALDSAKSAFDGARGTLDGTREDLREFTGATLPEVRELVAELRALTATLRRVADEAERNPSLLLRGRAPGKRGPGE